MTLLPALSDPCIVKKTVKKTVTVTFYRSLGISGTNRRCLLKRAENMHVHMWRVHGIVTRVCREVQSPKLEEIKKQKCFFFVLLHEKEEEN